MIRPVGVIIGVLLVLAAWWKVLGLLAVPRSAPSRATRSSYRTMAVLERLLVPWLPNSSCLAVIGILAPGLLVVIGVGLLGLSLLGFDVLACALFGLPPGMNAFVRFLRGSSGGMPLVALAWLSTLLLLAVLGSYLARFSHAYLRREQPLVRMAAEYDGLLDAELVLAVQLGSGTRSDLDALFGRWADWLAGTEFDQASYPGLLFAPPVSDLCWVDAAVGMLDSAALVLAVAPGWAPANSRVLVRVGSHCLQRAAGQLEIVLRPTAVSLHGREERAFSETLDLVRAAGLTVECGRGAAWNSFQKTRTQYAPHAAAIGTRLHLQLAGFGGWPKVGLRITSARE
jgi:hypothetical protein